MIDINKITLKNNAMFNIVMRRPNLCKKCLERILNKNISDISYPESERTIDLDLESKSIRLDIYCEDEDTSYNIELQNGINDDLPRRSRYYQDMIDIDMLEKGHEYTELKNVIVIFICTFDIFGKDRHLYTFENICIQDNNIHLDDKTTKIFLNTKGTMNDIPEPLKNFLEYIDTGSVTDDFTRELDETVVEVRKDKKWRNRIMTVEELIKDEAKIAKREGRQEERKLLNKLTELLINDDRIDDLKKSSIDSNYQDILIAEYKDQLSDYIS
ncbi:MAG: Rpn family recombination-promoting nuclease/putative transposase [Eubacterium sp.]|nr:Rpn family recombination-promoting nuclease/putative transposase [Eubacterium sp.]